MIKEDEIRSAIKKAVSKKTAPGPDGILNKVWEMSMEILAEGIKQGFNICLRKGIFPTNWKKAKVILLAKPKKSKDAKQTYRPICLLYEGGKLLERIIAGRIKEHLELKEILSDRQYGFRKGRTTCDATERVRQWTKERTDKGKIVMAVAIDIKNAFKSIRWPSIMEALRRHNFPKYLRRIIRDYLDKRYIASDTKEGLLEWEVTCGVPQGSILGPIL